MEDPYDLEVGPPRPKRDPPISYAKPKNRKGRWVGPKAGQIQPFGGGPLGLEFPQRIAEGPLGEGMKRSQDGLCFGAQEEAGGQP